MKRPEGHAALGSRDDAPTLGGLSMAPIGALAIVLAVGCGVSGGPVVNRASSSASTAPAADPPSVASASGTLAQLSPSAPTLVGTPPIASGDSTALFHLFVSNQSFDLPTLDIDVYLDGVHVVTGPFDVGRQHTYVPFRFPMKLGAHELRAVSKRGAVELRTPIELTAERWVVVEFWLSKDDVDPGTPASFTTRVFEQKPGFE